MVEVPAPTMVTVVPAMIATAVSELVYVIKPLLFVDGGVIVKAAFPNVFVIAENPDKSGIAWFTVMVAVVVAAVKFALLA